MVFCLFSFGLHHTVSQNEGKTLRKHSMFIIFKVNQPAFTCLISTVEILEKKRDFFSKLTIKIHKNVNWLCSGVFIINFEQRETNVKGDDAFAKKTTNMENVKRKNSGLNERCEK